MFGHRSRAENDRQRAQSEVVVAILTLIVGTVIVGNVSDQASGGPLVELNTATTASDLVFVHKCGNTTHKKSLQQ
jgi:hypothetical protein